MQGRISAGSACRRSGRSCLRQIARSERGGALIEIMMSALLVALAATAVFKGIDGATATSSQSKSRAVATTLAHEDQERLRAMDPRKLASYAPTPAKKTVDRTGATGVPAIPVTVDPPVGVTKNTNDGGCVVFDGLNSGAYFGQFSK